LGLLDSPDLFKFWSGLKSSLPWVPLNHLGQVRQKGAIGDFIEQVIDFFLEN
jgi:hypothetical protein